MRRNAALSRLRAGGVVIGPAFVFASPDLVEQAAHLGFDYVWIDWQHGEFTEPTLLNALGRFLATQSTPVVRVAGNDTGTINRVLDMGAMGIIVPMVETADEAAAVARAALFPPKGKRSAGGARLDLIAGSLSSYSSDANDEIMVVVMVESENAIANVREIMAVPGIDVVLIGPGDLLIDVTARGGDERRHEELVLEVAAAAKESGKAAGYVCADAEMVERRIEQGFRFINYGFDADFVLRIMRNMSAQAAAWRGTQ